MNLRAIQQTSDIDQEDRNEFWSKVNIEPHPSKCWEWTGNLSRTGYGNMTKRYKERKPIMAHRFSFILQGGNLTQDMLVCHTCDNPKCVRPDHLFIGDHSSNMLDKAKKFRTNGGITKDLAIKILEATKSEKSDLKISQQFKIHRETVYRIRNNKHKGVSYL